MNTFKAICLLAILLPVITQAQPANKTTAKISRLKTYAKIGYNFSTAHHLDSTVFFYSGDNAWDTELKVWRYDSSHQYTAVNHAAPTNTIRTYQDISTNINRTTNHTFYAPQASFTPRWRKTYTYSNGKVTEILHEDCSFGSQTWLERSKILMRYNSNGQLTDSILLRKSGSNWDSSERTRFQYGPYGKTLWGWDAYSNTGWTMFYEAVYSYTNGKLTEMNFGNARYIYSYDNNGHNIKTVVEQMGPSSWVMMDETYYTHDANGNILTEEYKDYTRTGTPFFKSTISYNSYNQPLHIKREVWENNVWKPAPDSTDTYFYYEEVFPSSVKEKAANSSTMTLYPVPAAKTLTIEIAQQQVSELVFSICTIDGKIIRQWNQPATSGQYKETISVGELPIGNYILKSGSNGTVISKQFQVVR